MGDGSQRAPRAARSDPRAPATPGSTPAPVPELVDDEALMAAFRGGHQAAFGVLFGRHARSIHRYLLRLGGDPALASDLTQATFLSVVKARDRYVSGARFRTWLYVIATNAWRDHHRRARREVVRDPGTLAGQAAEGARPDPFLDRRVRLALAALPEEQREAVVLHQIEGFSFGEIAGMIDVRESAVKVRAHRGYQRLRALLEDTWGGDEP